MIPKSPAYKLKNQTKDTQQQLNAPRYTTQYSLKKSIQIKNKLTKGCHKYEEIKDAYLKQVDNKIKTDYNQCTFQPRLSSKKKQSRSFKKFIEDQQNFQYNRNNKIRQFKTQINKAQATECSNRPSIDRISKRICTLMNYDKEQVVDRLYKKKVIEPYTDDEQLFSPKILPRSKSLIRTQNISDLLHSDALRRKQKKQVQQIEKQIHIPATPHILNNTYKLVCNKLYNQFCQLCPEDQTIIPLVMVWTIISQIFGIDLNPNKQGREGKICQDMTKFLCRDGEEEVQRSKLWDFVQVIIKKNQSKSKNFASEVNQIIDSFGHLYTCRIAKPRIQKSPEQFPFFPQTLRGSQSKAQKYRQKMLQQARQFLQNENLKVKVKQELTIEEIFSIDYLRRKAQQEKKRLNNQKQMMKQCTFQPKLSQSYNKAVYMPPRAVTNSKMSCSKNTLIKSISSQSLSQSFMSTSLKPLQLKSNIKPVQRQQKPKQPTHTNVNQIKNVQKSILRMKIARKDRQLSNQIKSRGYPKNVDNWIQYTQHQKTQINKQHQKYKGLNYKKVSLR